MSPVTSLVVWRDAGFPRVSGDEPRIEVEMPASAQFSPRERG